MILSPQGLLSITNSLCVPFLFCINIILLNNSKSPFFWVGVTSQTVQSLEPANEKIIAVQVGFISPGIYNLNRLRFSVFSNTHNEGDPEAKHIFYPFEHLITIKDSELM